MASLRNFSHPIMTKLIGNGQLKVERMEDFTIVYTTNIKECEDCAVCPRCQKA